MSKDTKRIVNMIGMYYICYNFIPKNVFLEFDSLSKKRLRHNVTCLLDLPDEVLLLICSYMLPYHVLYSFYTPERSDFRLHRTISDYYRKIKFDEITNSELIYLLNLFGNSKYPLRPESFILSNKHVSHLTQVFFDNINISIMNSICINLKSLTLINCSVNDIIIFNKYIFQMSLIEYLHITYRRIDDDNRKYNGDIFFF